MLAVALAVALALSGVMIFNLRTRSTTGEASLAYDSTCGRGGAPEPLFRAPPKGPVALVVGSKQATVGTNTDGLSGQVGIAQGLLMGFSATCRPIQPGLGNPLGTPLGTPDSPVRLTALAIGPKGYIYAAGADATGWVVARFKANGSTDTNFGQNGYISNEAASTSSDPLPSGAAAAITVADNGDIFVLGTSGRNIVLIKLTPTGSREPKFGAHGVVTTDLGPSAGTVTMALTSDGHHLLLGSNEAPNDSTDCAFTIEEYGSSGVRVPKRDFRTIVGAGRGVGCNTANTTIPPFPFAQLTSLLSLPDGDFLAIGLGSSDATPPLSLYSDAFFCWYDSNGLLEPHFNRDGILFILGSDNQIAAVAEPGNDIVAGIAGQSGISLTPIEPSGAKGVGVHLSPGPFPTFALGPAGGGKILLIFEVSGHWQLARYVFVSP